MRTRFTAARRRSCTVYQWCDFESGHHSEILPSLRTQNRAWLFVWRFHQMDSRAWLCVPSGGGKSLWCPRPEHEIASLQSTVHGPQHRTSQSRSLFVLYPFCIYFCPQFLNPHLGTFPCSTAHLVYWTIGRHDGRLCAANCYTVRNIYYFLIFFVIFIVTCIFPRMLFHRSTVQRIKISIYRLNIVCNYKIVSAQPSWTSDDIFAIRILDFQRSIKLRACPTTSYFELPFAIADRIEFAVKPHLLNWLSDYDDLCNGELCAANYTVRNIHYFLIFLNLCYMRIFKHFISSFDCATNKNVVLSIKLYVLDKIAACMIRPWIPL